MRGGLGALDLIMQFCFSLRLSAIAEGREHFISQWILAFHTSLGSSSQQCSPCPGLDCCSRKMFTVLDVLACHTYHRTGSQCEKTWGNRMFLTQVARCHHVPSSFRKGPCVFEDSHFHWNERRQSGGCRQRAFSFKTLWSAGCHPASPFTNTIYFACGTSSSWCSCWWASVSTAHDRA